MTHQELFVAANRALKAVIDQIKDEQWDTKVPPGMSWKPDQTLRDLVNYHSYDDAWAPDVLAGKTAVEVGDKYDSDLLGNDPKGNYAKYNEIANKAVENFKDLEKTVHLSYGDFSATEYLNHITLFRGLRVYDMAKHIGADTKMPHDLVQGLWDYVKPNAEALREMQVFGPAVEVPTDAPLQDRLLGLAGRSIA